jgi:hypothetical protein
MPEEIRLIISIPARSDDVTRRKWALGRALLTATPPSPPPWEGEAPNPHPSLPLGKGEAPNPHPSLPLEKGEALLSPVATTAANL